MGPCGGEVIDRWLFKVSQVVIVGIIIEAGDIALFHEFAWQSDVTADIRLVLV